MRAVRATALSAEGTCRVREEWRSLPAGSGRQPVLLPDPSVALRDEAGPRYFVHGGLEPSDWRAFVFSKACATTSAMVALISIRR